MARADSGILAIAWSVRTPWSPIRYVPQIQLGLKEASGGLAVARVRSMEDVVSQSTARRDFTAVLLTGFARASLLLAAVGIYGLMAFYVRQRRPKIRIRHALGRFRIVWWPVARDTARGRRRGGRRRAQPSVSHVTCRHSSMA
jgi:hypothetical protein